MKIDNGDNVQIVTSKDNCTVYQVRDNSGDGVMTSYMLFDGVGIMFNDFHMSKCKSEFSCSEEILCMDYCVEGRIEQEIKPGVFRYIEAGDLRIDNHTDHDVNFNFPLSHYHGITVSLDVNLAEESIKKHFPDCPISIKQLADKYCSSDNHFIIRDEDRIAKIFSSFYNVPESIREYFYKIKVIELLLYLHGTEIDKKKSIKPYFYKSQIEKIKTIRDFLTENVHKHYTLEELSSEFDISLTAMKKCFKAVYGDTIYSYLRKARMNKAAEYLTKTKMTVAAIANETGYESPSKFSSAFKKEIGMLPLEYRNIRRGGMRNE